MSLGVTLGRLSANFHVLRLLSAKFSRRFAALLKGSVLVVTSFDKGGPSPYQKLVSINKTFVFLEIKIYIFFNYFRNCYI